MLERTVEDRVTERAARRGGMALKFVSPGRRGVPDRIVLLPIPPEHRSIVARYVRFLEVKRPGAKPRPEQAREHARLRALGVYVGVPDSLVAVDAEFDR